LSCTCDFEKEGGFIGRQHVLAEKAEAKGNGGYSRRMANVLVPLESTTRYSTTLKYFGDGERISDIQGGSYGHTVGGGVGLTMLQSKSGEPINRDYIQNARWELEIANCQQEISLFSFFGAILRSKEHPHQGMSRTNSVVRAKSYSL
jgi:glycine cleavage system aminomethyltransferase T